MSGLPSRLHRPSDRAHPGGWDQRRLRAARRRLQAIHRSRAPRTLPSPRRMDPPRSDPLRQPRRPARPPDRGALRSAAGQPPAGGPDRRRGRRQAVQDGCRVRRGTSSSRPPRSTLQSPPRADCRTRTPSPPSCRCLATAGCRTRPQVAGVGHTLGNGDLGEAPAFFASPKPGCTTQSKPRLEMSGTLWGRCQAHACTCQTHAGQGCHSAGLSGGERSAS